MKKQIGKWIAALLAAGIVLSLAGCSSGPASGSASVPASTGSSTAVPEAGSDVVTIKYYESTDNQVFAEAVVEAFNESHDDIQ